MAKEHMDHGEYILQVRENTRKYIDSLRGEILSLRKHVGRLEEDRNLLEQRLTLASAEMDTERSERERLIQQFDELEDERSRTADYHASIEEQNNNLANLYVAAYGLHGTLDISEVICVIKEIVANLVGSEEVAIFEVIEEGSALALLDGHGVDIDSMKSLATNCGMIGHAVTTGELCVPDRVQGVEALPHESGLTACIPLKINDLVYGAIAVFGLLQQKTGLDPLDFEIFDLLGTQAAIALRSAKLHATFRASRD